MFPAAAAKAVQACLYGVRLLSFVLGLLLMPPIGGEGESSSIERSL
jgi:hypothetical protein